MADLRLNVVANTRQPRTEIESLRRDIHLLRTQTNQTQQSTTAAGQAVDRFGDEAREAAMGVTTLGRSIFQTSEQAKRFDGVFRGADGRLREANGRYVKGREAVEGLGRSFGGASGGAQVFTRSLGGLGTVLGSLGVAAAGVGVLSFGASTVRAAAQMEALERGLRLVEGSAAAAEMRLETLQILANLPGLQLAPLVRYNNILREVGLTTGEVDTVVTSLGNAIVSFGGNAETVDRVFTQLSQSFSQNKLEAEEFNTVLESVPSLRGIIQDVLGLSGGTQELGEAFKAAGGDLIDFLLPVFERLQTEIPTAPLDSYAASVDTLGNSFTQLQAVIGEGFLPVIGSAARGLAGFLDNIREGIEGTKNFTEVIAELNAELTRASGTIELREAIDEGVDALEAFIRQSEAAIRNNSVFFGAREDAILIGQINQANEALTEFVGVQERNIETEAELRAELVKQEAELARIQGLQTDRNNLIAEQGRTAERASRIYLENLTKEEIAVNASIDDLEKKLTGFEKIPPAVDEVTASTVEATASTKELTTEVLRLTEIYKGLTQNIQETSETVASLTRTGDAEFYRLVRGELEAYGGAVDTVIPSVINLKNELEALTSAFDANLQVLDPESDVIDNLVRGVTDLSTPLTDASDETQALAQELRDLIHQANIAQSISEPFEVLREDINLVNPAISAAAETMENYITVMGAVQGEFQTIDTLSDRLTASIRDQASAFDELRQKVERFNQSESQRRQQRGIQPPRLPGETITSERAFGDLDRLFGTDPASRQQASEAATEAEREFNERIRNIDTGVFLLTDSLSGLDGTLGDLVGTLGSIDFTALLSGNPFATVAEIGTLFVDLFQDVHAARQQILRDREATARLVDRVIVNAAADERIQADFQERGQVATGIGRNASIDDAIVQSLYGTGLGNITPNLDVLERAYQPFIASLQTGMEAAGSSLEHAISLELDPAVITRRVDELQTATTDFYDIQIEEVRAAAALSGNDPRNAVFALVQERDAIINEATNLLRNRQPAGPQNAVQFRAATGFVGPTAGLTPGQDDQERGLTQGEVDAAVAELDPAIAQLASFSADDTFSNNVEAFRMSVNAAGQTIEGINAAIGSFTENVLRPEFERLRGLILDDDGVISAAEALELKQQGLFTFEDFSEPFLQLGEDAISGVQAAESALENFVAESGFQENVDAFRMSINAEGATVADVNTAWQAFVENTLRPEFERLRGLIVNDDGVISAAEGLELREAGLFMFSDFTDGFMGLRDAAVMGIETAAAALANYIAESEFSTNVDEFRMSVNAAGLTVEDVNIAWAVFVENTLRPEFERLRGLILDDDGVISATEALELREAGLFMFSDFTDGFMGLRDAAVMGIETAAAALANYIAESQFDSNVDTFRMSLNAAGITIEDINSAWEMFIENTLRPEFERLRGLILDDDGIIDAVEELSLRRAGVFTFEDFTGDFIGIRDAAVTSLTNAQTARARVSSFSRSTSGRTASGRTAEQIRAAAEALETRTANRLAQEALGAIREAAEDANITEAAILDLWQTALPLIEAWYQELLDDVNAITDAGERREALDALGTPEAFIASLKSQYVTPVIMGIQRNQEALETRTASRLANEALDGLRELGSDVNVTEQAIADAWTAALPFIENWYQELLDDANAIENEGLRTEALDALGSPEQFVANLKSQYVTPVITGLQRSQEARETRTANRLAQDALKGLREMGADVNVTEQAITDAWTAALPFIENWYQELLDDANAIENEADRGDALDALGSPEAFVANLKSQYVSPVLMGITQSTEALQTRTANREANDAIQALRDVADDVNVTEQAIVDKWQEAIPFIQTWWQELYDDIVNNENLNEGQIRESLDELGTVEAFVGNIRSQYVTPVLNNILGTQFQNRSNAAQTRLNRSQFNFGGATSESDFETRRTAVIEAINAYYDAEEERIDNLEASEADLKDLRDGNDLARDRALQQATTATNRFAEERLRTEQRLSDEIEGIRDDQLENEADRQQSLQDLAEDHQDRLTDIERDGLRRREDLQRELSRDFADNFREEQEQIAELLSGEGFDTREIRRFLQGFEGNVRGRLGEDALSQLNEIQREGAVESIDLRRERDRDLEDIGIREGRQVEDAQIRLQQQTEDINAEAEATATALTASLAPLLGMQAMLTQQQQDTAVLENVTATNTAATAATQVRTAMKEETNAAMTAATARVESNTAARRSAIAAMEARLQEQTATNTERFGMGVERFVEIPDLFLEVGERLTMSADRLDFSAAALTQSAELWATALGRDIELPVSEPRDIGTELAMGLARDVMTFSADIVNINANSVNLNADIAGGVSSPQTPTRPVQRTVRNDVTLEIDGQTLGRIVDEVLVRLDTNGGTVGQYVRSKDNN